MLSRRVTANLDVFGHALKATLQPVRVHPAQRTNPWRRPPGPLLLFVQSGSEGALL